MNLLPRRKRVLAPPITPNWLREKIFTFNERRPATGGGYKYVEQTIEPGDKFRVKNEMGWFVFKSLVTNLDNNAQWVDCIQLFGVKQEQGPMRSFRPERVTKKFRVIKRRKPRKTKQVTDGLAAA